MNTWMDYIDDLHFEGRVDESTRELIAEGKIEICPICMGLGAFSARHVNPQFRIAKIPYVNGNQWECPHCATLMSDRTELQS